MNAPEGYELQFEYELSWNKNVVNTKTDVTSGFIEIYNNTTNALEATYTINGTYDVVITDKGIDPTNSSNEVFGVSFRTTAIPTEYINGDIFANTFTVKVSANFSTDCNFQYSLYSLPVSLFGFTSNTGLNPCDRNEKAWFQLPSNFNGKKIGVSGYDPGFGCANYGGTFVRTDLQQVAYSLNNGNTWNLFSNATAPSNNPILSQGYLQQTDYAESPVLNPGTYTVILRYRNWKYNSFPNLWLSSHVPTRAPFLANSACRYLGGSFTPETALEVHASYSYEYWPLVTITP